MNRSLSVDLWIRRVLGATVIMGVVIMAQVGDTNVNLGLSRASAAEAGPSLPDEGPLPDLGTGPRVPQTSNNREQFMPEMTVWLNSAPLTSDSLRGKVVLVDFWTYSCINSLRNLPYIQRWAAKYKDAGLVVIGVHTPEFSFEKERPNVEWAVRDYKVAYPVAIDSDYRIWQSFNNEYWPADYFVDGKGRIRYHHFGEGDYDLSERIIQELLKENGATGLTESTVQVSAQGVEAPPSKDERSPETYVGYHRAENFASPERVAQDARKTYTVPASLSLNHWGLSGAWNVRAESGLLEAAPGTIAFRFHSRDLHFVLGPRKDGQPVRFRVTLDGVAPGDNCGADCARDGTGVVKEPRLYQLIRQKDQIKDRTFTIEFLDPGVQAYVFTFG